MLLHRVTVPFTPGSAGRRLWGHATSRGEANRLKTKAVKSGHARQDVRIHTVKVPDRLTLRQWCEVLDADGMAGAPDDIVTTISELAEIVP